MAVDLLLDYSNEIKVLLLEDDIIDQMSFKRFVDQQNLDYNYMIGKSLSEGKDLIKNNNFDVVIVDYSLGDGTGLEVLDIIKDTPVIFVTGGGDEEIAVKALKKGAYDYLIKDSERNYLKILPITVEKALKEKNKKQQIRILSQAIMSTNDNVYITNMKNEFVFVNNAFTNSYGFQYDEIKNNCEKIIWNSSNGEWKNSTIRGEYYHTRKDGFSFPVDVSKSVILGDEGTELAIVSVTRDVSERKKAFDEIQKVSKELKILNDNKDKFFSIMAHDLKNPFSALLAYSDFIMNDFSELSVDEIKEFAEGINKVAKNVYDLLENLLDWSRIQTGRMEYDPVKINIHDIAVQVHELYYYPASQKDVTIELRSNCKCETIADRNMIYTIIRNLISNAVKFTNNGGKVIVEIKDMGEYILTEISDTGIGIKNEDIDKLFKINVHHTTIGTSEEKGTGLGLILCKELVEKNGGKIWVESEVNKGTKFSFTITKKNKI